MAGGEGGCREVSDVVVVGAGGWDSVGRATASRCCWVRGGRWRCPESPALLCACALCSSLAYADHTVGCTSICASLGSTAPPPPPPQASQAAGSSCETLRSATTSSSPTTNLSTSSRHCSSASCKRRRGWGEEEGAVSGQRHGQRQQRGQCQGCGRGAGDGGDGGSGSAAAAAVQRCTLAAGGPLCCATALSLLGSGTVNEPGRTSRPALRRLPCCRHWALGNIGCSWGQPRSCMLLQLLLLLPRASPCG